MEPHRILVVRLGSMGDILHALPAVAQMRRKWPDAVIEWAVHPKWNDLLEANPLAVQPIFVDRRDPASRREAITRLRAGSYDFAIDFQGLIQSAIVSRIARRKTAYGFHRSMLREWAASLLYSHSVRSFERHVVDRNMALAAAAGADRGGAEFPLPVGRPEGELPDRFILAAPLAGWTSKQWPLEYYEPLADRLKADFGLALVLNGAPNSEAPLRTVKGVQVHISGISGLIDATRRALGIVGLDSGPMHLAAALRKPGVALFGPTDPERNGPYGETIVVLRHPSATTTYKRGTSIDPALRALTPQVVADALARRLQVALSNPQEPDARGRTRSRVARGEPLS